LIAAVTKLVVRPYRRSRPARKSVAIVVPLSSRPDLSPEDELSLRHLCHYLGRYDKYLLMPDNVSVEREGFKSIRFPVKFFGSAAAHNHLLMWPRFYRAFESYEYILMYHLDSLVLGNDLEEWCKAGYDYIGAPWLPCSDTPWVKEPRVGNGGFALMKVESVLKVLHNRYRNEPATYWSDLLTRNRARCGLLIPLLERFQKWFPESRIVNRPLEDWRITAEPAKFGRNNDFFWSFDAMRHLPGFKLAPVNEGLRFAFEAAPRLCFEMNGQNLPFGCHAWTKFDRAFWEPHLLPANGHR
jgi:hypothetical protein